MEILERAWNQVHDHAAVLARGSAFPIWTERGEWKTIDVDQGERGVLPHHGSWMVGDLPAILWFASSRPPADAADRAPHALATRADALTWSNRLKNRSGLRSFASVAHMFFRGTLVGMVVGDEPELGALAAEAAQTVAERFREIGYMKSFGPPDDSDYPFTTVDDVINLTVPIWFARQRDDAQLDEIARHAIDVIAEHLVRPDGSAAQVLLFDPAGNPTGVDTYQGYSPDGCWSRGQAWGIYGYAAAARVCRSAHYLEIADRLADYWIDRVQDDPSPVWDFDLPDGEPLIRDSFAASLAYAGILEVAAQSDERRRDELTTYSQQMLARLAQQYMLDRTPGLGILADAALDVPHNHGVGESVIVGDSYFVEALWRLLCPQIAGAGLYPRGGNQR
jgi:unsaturated chondroitin disaccharide hydrolase